MGLKRKIQALVAQTEDHPLMGKVYKQTYRLFIKAIVKELSKERGVEAIYLHRGLSGDEFVYGLSDIDILVFVSRESTEQEKKRIKDSYLKLAELIPPLRKSLDEIGVYSLEDFQEMINTVPFYRYRFLMEHERWKLLWGKDVRERIKVNQAPGIQDAWEEARVWWKSLARILFKDNHLPGIMQGYTWHKALAELSRIYFYLRYSDVVQGRKEALEKLKGEVPAEGASLVDRVVSFKKNRVVFTREEYRDSLVALALDLLTRIADLAEDGLSPPGKGEPVEIELPPFHLPALPEDPPGEIHLIPRLEFHPDILAPRDIGHWEITILSPTIRASRLKKFMEKISLSPRWRKPKWEMLWSNGRLALSLNPEEPWDAIKIPSSDPIFFAVLKSKKTPVPQGRTLKTQRILVETDHGHILQGLLEKKTEKLRNILSSEDLVKMAPSRFLTFFWSSLRQITMTLAMKAGETIPIPLTPEGITMEVARFHPETGETIEDLAARAQDQGGLLYRDTLKAIGTLKTLLERCN